MRGGNSYAYDRYVYYHKSPSPALTTPTPIPTLSYGRRCGLLDVVCDSQLNPITTTLRRLCRIVQAGASDDSPLRVLFEYTAQASADVLDDGSMVRFPQLSDQTSSVAFEMAGQLWLRFLHLLEFPFQWARLALPGRSESDGKALARGFFEGAPNPCCRSKDFDEKAAMLLLLQPCFYCTSYSS